MKVLCCESCSSGQRLAAPTERGGVGGRRSAFSFGNSVVDLKQRRDPGCKPSRSLTLVQTLFRRGTPSPAQRPTAVQGNSGCGRAARCSPASVPRCPCPAGSSPPRTAPRPGSGPPARQSSGPASSSCCVLSTGPRRGAWPGRRRAAVWTHPGPRRASLGGAEWAARCLETDGKGFKSMKTSTTKASVLLAVAHCCGWCGTSSCAGEPLCRACRSPWADFGCARGRA